MPKVISERERELTLDAIYRCTIELIKKRGSLTVTVDEITHSVNIAKGSFYKYYPSKEACFYEVIRRAERELFSRLEVALASLSVISDLKLKKEYLAKSLHDIYLAADSFVLYLPLNEFIALMRKLPAEYEKRERKKSESYVVRTFKALGIIEGKLQGEVLANLMDSLAFIASKRAETPASKKAMELIINALAEYLIGGI